jgi:hypothetical protein
MRRIRSMSLICLLFAFQPARAELLQLDLSIFGMD